MNAVGAEPMAAPVPVDPCLACHQVRKEGGGQRGQTQDEPQQAQRRAAAM